ncbi:ATP-grasp domain-containing protein [Streptomyces albus]|uniref:D-alanine--D-alanine ligase family protein n=1 Tax=Streptomyces albus TaxID=1888 RepID=UPI0037012734
MTRLIDHRDLPALRDEIHTLTTWRQSQAQSQPLRVALVYGGVSEEDRLYISQCPTNQLSVTALSESLTEIGTVFEVLDPCDPRFIRDLSRFEVVLSNLHGPYGEDGRLQGLLDYLRKPYAGNSVAACAVAADKLLCKRVMHGLGVPTPSWQVGDRRHAVQWIGRPMMIKPPLGGSSVGMSLVREEKELAPALETAWSTDSSSSALAEEYIEGVPVTVGLLELPGGLVVLPPLATTVKGADFYDADTKLHADESAPSSVEVTRTDFPEHTQAALTRCALTLWEGLGCQGTARIDFIVTSNGAVYALEVNPTPGMSRDSNFVAGAAMVGMSHADVVTAMLHQAMRRRPYDVPLPAPVFGDSSTPVREPSA